MFVEETLHEEIMDAEKRVLEIVVELISFDFVPLELNTDNYQLACECLSLRLGSHSLLVGSLPKIVPGFHHVGKRECTNPDHPTGISADSWKALLRYRGRKT